MELLERDREREALETAIEESRARGVVVVVEGEAGIGKTALDDDHHPARAGLLDRRLERLPLAITLEKLHTPIFAT